MGKISLVITLRKERAKKFLSKYQDELDLLWEIRNIYFYGNVKLGSPKREISRKEVQHGINVVEKVITEIERILEDEK